MRWFMILVGMLHPISATADDGWAMLSGDDIATTLTDRTLDYGDKWQDFRASGRTLYFSGADSWGYWEVRGDAYCSMWPPSDLWACYGMSRQGDKIRFIGQGGEITEGVLRPIAQ